ncbi:MAG: hypothetical protein WCK48_03185 [bacterium]
MNSKKLFFVSVILVVILFGWVWYKNSGYQYFNYYVLHQGMPPHYCDPGPCNIEINKINNVDTAEVKAIENVDFKKFLSNKYETSNYQPKNGGCEIGSTSIQDIYYGDLTGDGIEEVVVNYRTCNNGTGGGSSEVYKLDNQNNLVNITPDSTKLSAVDQKKFFDGFAGHGYFGISNSKLIFAFPVYKNGDSNANPTGGISTITFGWDGNKFTYDKVTTAMINP